MTLSPDPLCASQIEAQILNVLTTPDVVSLRTLDDDWDVESLLDDLAKATPPYHALIDTGTLVAALTLTLTPTPTLSMSPTNMGAAPGQAR